MTTLSDRLLALAARAATEDKAIRSLVNGNSADLSALRTTAKTTLDTIAELAAALADDQSAVAAITTALTYRVRVDAAQTFDDTQIAQAWSNIGLGDYAVDPVAAFEAAQV